MKQRTFIKKGNDLIGLRPILSDLSDGEYQIRRVEKIRSIDQNSRYWGILQYIANETQNDQEALHELMKKKFLSTRKLVKIGKTRKYIWKTKSTTKLTTQEFSFYNEKVEGFFRDFGIVVPDPNDGYWDSLLDEE